MHTHAHDDFVPENIGLDAVCSGQDGRQQRFHSRVFHPVVVAVAGEIPQAGVAANACVFAAQLLGKQPTAILRQVKRVFDTGKYCGFFALQPVQLQARI